MTDLVSSNFAGFLTSTTQSAATAPVVWNFIKAHLNRHELERFVSFKKKYILIPSHAHNSQVFAEKNIPKQ
jgi:hypothetical protein